MTKEFYIGWLISLLALVIVAVLGIRLGESNKDELVLSNPTTLYLTVATEEGVPQVCALEIVTETARDKDLHVVVRQGLCPALAW